MIGPLRQLGHEGPRHTGCYGFGGRLTRRMYGAGGDRPALFVDRDVWARLAGQLAAEYEHRYGPGAGIPGVFGMPVVILDPVDAGLTAEPGPSLLDRILARWDAFIAEARDLGVNEL